MSRLSIRARLGISSSRMSCLKISSAAGYRSRVGRSMKCSRSRSVEAEDVPADQVDVLEGRHHALPKLGGCSSSRSASGSIVVVGCWSSAASSRRPQRLACVGAPCAVASSTRFLPRSAKQRRLDAEEANAHLAQRVADTPFLTNAAVAERRRWSKAAWVVPRKNGSYLQSPIFGVSRAGAARKKAILAVAASMSTAAHFMPRDKTDLPRPRAAILGRPRQVPRHPAPPPAFPAPPAVGVPLNPQARVPSSGSGEPSSAPSTWSTNCRPTGARAVVHSVRTLE